MTIKDIAHSRLVSQQIEMPSFKNPGQLVGWMGAMQAQDYLMAKWAIGVRLPNATSRQIEAAIDKGEIIRTHVMRPTWHFIAAADIYWLLELTAPGIRAQMKSHDKALELTESIYKKANGIISKALANKQHLTRPELMAKLEKAKIVTNEYRSGHIMLRAELDGIVCSGATMENKQTYALLPDRVPKTKILNREEALKELAQRYFLSHCPATIADFTWWSGLPAKDATHALELIKDKLVSEKIGTSNYWLPNSFSITKKKSGTHLLPAFDEFLISYKDRSASLQLEHQPKAFSKNGIFYPVIVSNGQVQGLWKRTFKKDKVIIVPDFLKAPSATAKKQFEKAAKLYGKFLDKKVEVVYPEV